ncbi:hypothetical protein [Cohnella rhizosphaerae]|uniref:Uncharacterized protein n=1 Tax=Cohnella rhizosphaerae TaxID=1457232 RepID=A0A9X4KPA6_9BACL|nr:hypothetical protein [Cohnella rhizosphaerae]MDG0808686.1 hypothetical protein [Cohnella rhizosphaerae]
MNGQRRIQAGSERRERIQNARFVGIAVQGAVEKIDGEIVQGAEDVRKQQNHEPLFHADVPEQHEQHERRDRDGIQHLDGRRDVMEKKVRIYGVDDCERADSPPAPARLQAERRKRQP